MHGWCVCVHGWCVCVHACMWIKCTVIMYKQDTSGLCHHLVLIAYIVTCKNREEALTEIIKHALNNILLCMQMTWIPARRNHLDSLSYLWHKISQSASPLHYFRYCSWSKLRNEVRKFFSYLEVAHETSHTWALYHSACCVPAMADNIWEKNQIAHTEVSNFSMTNFVCSMHGTKDSSESQCLLVLSIMGEKLLI